MIRWAVWIQLFAFFIFADEIDLPRYSGTTNQLTYGGLTIKCPWGCGKFEEDDRIEEISEHLEQTVKKLFNFCSPLYLGWRELGETPFPFSPWKIYENDYAIYNWPQTKGMYLPNQEREKISLTDYPRFLEIVSRLRRDLRFYYLDVYNLELNLYKSALPILKKQDNLGEYGYVKFNKDGELRFFDWGTYTGGIIPIHEFIKDKKQDIQRLEKNLSDFYPERYEHSKELLEKTIQEIDTAFYEIFIWCLRNHQPEGIFFKATLEDFMNDDVDQAIIRIRKLIEIVEELGTKRELLAKLHLLKGQFQSEMCRYEEAIIDLTAAIQKDPSMKEAYFERAAAYFELGHFDQAITDYLSSDMRSGLYNSTQLALGIGSGILQGSYSSLTDFVPSTLSTLRGLGLGLWAFSKNPMGASEAFVQASVACVEYLRSQPTIKVVQDMVPELKNLIQNYDRLNDFEKGSLIGLVIGKYSVDIFLTKNAATALKSYRDLKKANQLMTLEALASPEKTQTILAEAEKRWTHREQVIKNGNLKIMWDKQGKHVKGHKNYEQLLEDGKKPSFLTHKNPERLLRDFAGTGTKFKGEIPGTPGYVETVNFGEVIGYAVDPLTNSKTATTWGKIHYAQDGVHIVPTKPRS